MLAEDTYNKMNAVWIHYNTEHLIFELDTYQLFLKVQVFRKPAIFWVW